MRTWIYFQKRKENMADSKLWAKVMISVVSENMDLHDEKGKHGRTKLWEQVMSTCRESLFYRDHTQQKQQFVS